MNRAGIATKLAVAAWQGLSGVPLWVRGRVEALKAAERFDADEEDERLAANWLAGPGRRPTAEDLERWATCGFTRRNWTDDEETQ